MKRGVAFNVLHIRVSSQFQKNSYKLKISTFHCDVERSELLLVFRIELMLLDFALVFDHVVAIVFPGHRNQALKLVLLLLLYLVF